MLYVKVNKKNEIISELKDMWELRKENPNVSFPAELTQNEAAEFGYRLFYDKYPVLTEELKFDEVLVEDRTEFVNGAFYRNWKISKISKSEKEKRMNDKWKEIREKRNELLSRCDWCILPDSPLSEKDKKLIIEYRKTLRNITEKNKNPFTVSFPDYPL